VTGLAPVPSVAVVAIGRNEGPRLQTCLKSVLGVARGVVYVDSGSTDGSVDFARSLGAEVVELDPRMPFAPGRARNVGFSRLQELWPDVSYVQFVDGDCEIAPGWLPKAAAFLDENLDVAVVAGRRRERHPERSVYNLLCAIEWNLHPVGEAAACGGDALMRTDAFAASGGFRPDLMSGEEPDLCQRLRAGGWRVWFLDEVLTLHDAAMTRFGQWWKRSKRSGYGTMQRAWLCRSVPGVAEIREVAGTWLWAAFVPGAIVFLAVSGSAWALWLPLVYPLQVGRLALMADPRGASSWRDRCWYATFIVLAKFPKLLGQLECLTVRWLRRHPQLIEYKTVDRDSATPRHG